MASIEITKSAEKYLDELLQKQDSDTIGVKVFVSEPGSPRAETCIAYCKEDDDKSEYEIKPKKDTTNELEKDHNKFELTFIFDSKLLIITILLQIVEKS